MFKVQNRPEHQMVFEWPGNVPEALVEDAKAALYAWYKRGKPGWKTPAAATVFLAMQDGKRTLQHLARVGVQRFDQVRPIHVCDYVEHMRAVEKVGPTTLRYRLEILELVRLFRQDVKYPFVIDPWAGDGLRKVCGMRDGIAVGKTPVIPPAVQASIFNYAELILSRAAALLDARDAGKIGPFSTRLVEVRNAVLYLLQISTGMRNSEATGVRNGAWRTERKSGTTFHWIKTWEHKTGKGLVEFLAPVETLRALETLQRWAAPYQSLLRAEIERLEQVLAEPVQRGHKRRDQSQETLSTGVTRVAAMQRLEQARASSTSLFLTLDHRSRTEMPGVDGQVKVMSVAACNAALRRLAVNAGVDWELANHQCRRTFAWLIAQSRLGANALVFLKWQLKHCSMSMTQLYAANPRQDGALYEEIRDEISTERIDVMESWFDGDEPLAGGAGKKIKELRATAIKDRRSLLLHTAQHVNIRGTGHSWCLAEQRGCGGEGLYEPIKCADCSTSVIDGRNIGVWQNIHLQNLELGKVTDCGPGVQQRAAREIEISAEVLKELGVAVPEQGDNATDGEIPT
ncbi:integrase [Azohydromonas lata]|uniref:integrase n=1 Tax=Azohydromonas lata TaxID=45677 RepID=UPI001471FD3F|nr:integrase [Azohydromonas lata]